MPDHITCIVSFFFAGCFVLSPRPEAQGHYYEGQLQYQQPEFHGGWQRYRPPAPPLLKPVDLMADAVNSLGSRVLQQYVEHGNVAFSPAGLGFILAALYEGSAGRGRQQIVDCLGYPRNREIVRIGLGDIHRRLRTYLNPDGFLGGLNLNRENTNLRPEYEAVLMIYGFDLSLDFSNFGPNGTNNFGLKGSSAATTTTGTLPTTSMPVTSTLPTTTTAAATTSPAANDGVTTAPAAGSTSTDSSADVVTTSMAPPAATSTISQPEPDSQPTSPPSTTTPATTSATTLLTTTTTLQPVAPTTLAPSTSEPATSTNQAPSTTLTPSFPETTTPIDDGIATVAPPDIAGFRRKRSSDAYFSSYPDEGLWMQDLNAYADQPALPTDVRDATELQFLVNGCEPASVPAASYTTVLPFAYFPGLKAAGLEFPLDNPRYSVLLFLPYERVDTSRLARELTGQKLRLLRKHLQPTWIRATIPSFMLRGFVTLTPYLQRLGIRDVFEPRLADLSPMTPDLGVYARDVQQSVAVNIRNFMRSNEKASSAESTRDKSQGEYRYLRPANGLLDRLGLVSFTAERPFLYFIIDNETSVSLIAGRIDDPLNSRIL